MNCSHRITAVVLIGALLLAPTAVEANWLLAGRAARGLIAARAVGAGRTMRSLASTSRVGRRVASAGRQLRSGRIANSLSRGRSAAGRGMRSGKQLAQKGMTKAKNIAKKSGRRLRSRLRDERGSLRVGGKTKVTSANKKLRQKAKYTRSSQKRLHGAKGQFKGRYEDHHLIPVQHGNSPAFVQSGRGFNLRSNRMILPTKKSWGGGRRVHKGWDAWHSKYNKKVGWQMKKIEKIGKKRGWKQADYDRAIGRLQQNLRKKLRHDKLNLRIPG
jgi:hypothetical protein